MQKSDAATYAQMFKALADETRLTILLLLNAKARTVSEIVEFFSLSQPTISRHLIQLKQAGLLDSRRRGQQVIYSLNEEGLQAGMRDFFSGFTCLAGQFKGNRKK